MNNERWSALRAIFEEVVEMRFFAGLDFAEIAEPLGVTERTVYRRWCLARAWLRREIGGADGS
jgi:DNA-directed RNA polymerase specialized sigma24 family protein